MSDVGMVVRTSDSIKLKIKAPKLSTDASKILYSMRLYGPFLTIFFTSINTFFASLSKMAGIETHPITVFLAVIIYGMTIVSAIICLWRINSYCKIILFFFLISFILSLPFNSQYLLGGEVLRYFWVESIPVFIALASIEDYDQAYIAFSKVSKVVILFQTFISIGNHMQASWVDRSNYMEISYQLLLPVSFLLIKKNSSIFEKILVVLGSFIILFEGGRLAFLALGAVLIYNFLFDIKNKRKLLLSMVFTVLLVIVVLNFDSIMLHILQFAQRENLYGHFIRTLRTGTVFVSNSRAGIYDKGLDLIGKNPIFGYGIGGDRNFMSGSYVHQLFLELWIDYGVIMGTLLIFAILYLLFKVFRLKENGTKSIILALFFSMGFIKLMLSSSYFLEPSFFAMVAISVNCLRSQKKNNEIKTSLIRIG